MVPEMLSAFELSEERDKEQCSAHGASGPPLTAQQQDLAEDAYSLC
jgi:hypothetical protein